MSDTVTRDDAGGVATLTLQRPGLSSALRSDLLAAVQEVAADESVRAVLLTGTGRAFCVGQDLAEHVESLRGNAATSLSVVEEEYNPLILALAALRVPVVVGDQRRLRRCGAGHRAGRRPAGRGGRREVHDGVHRDRPVQRLGAGRAAGALRRGVAGDPAAAARPSRSSPRRRRSGGWCTAWSPAEQVLPEAQALAARLAAGPTAAYRAMKTVLATAATDSLEETLALEARLQTRAGPDRRPPRGGRGVPGQAGAGVHRPLNGPAAPHRAQSGWNGPLRGPAASLRVVGSRGSCTCRRGELPHPATGRQWLRCRVPSRACERWAAAGSVSSGESGAGGADVAGGHRPRLLGRTRASEPQSVSSQAPSTSAGGRCTSTACHSAAVGPWARLRAAAKTVVCSDHGGEGRQDGGARVTAPAGPLPRGVSGATERARAAPGQDAGHGADQARPRLRRPQRRRTDGW